MFIETLNKNYNQGEGFISPSHCVPFAAPGVITQAIKWMFDQKSPFYIKPHVDPELWSWIWKFRAACKKEVMLKSVPVLWQLGRTSAEFQVCLCFISGGYGL
jgi:D-amino-acid dehydrogenase